jgi:hypothetical protein
MQLVNFLYKCLSDIVCFNLFKGDKGNCFA